jgi:NADP-reducing hydrogenase subunit HndC
MAQTGGTAGGCLSAELLDVPMDYDQMEAAGVGLGSGALLVMDDSHCIVDIVACFMKFFKHESCGKCTLCREGTARLYEIVERMTRGEGRASDVDVLKSLSSVMQVGTLCALGQSAPKPLMTCLKAFADEFDAHIQRHVCPTGVCRMTTDQTA